MIAGLSLLISGCVTPIANLEVTPFDRTEASAENTLQINQKLKEKYSKKVRVTVEASAESNEAMKTHSEYLSEKISASLNALSFFQVVAIKDIGSITNMNAKAEIMDGEQVETKLEATDYMITYKLLGCNFIKNKIAKGVHNLVASAGSAVSGIHKDTGDGITKGGENLTSGIDTKVEVDLRISLVKVNDLSTSDILVKGESDFGQNGAAKTVQQAIDDAVGKVIAKLASRFAPLAKVIATKGEGKAALINIGTNMGVQINSTVDFINFKKDTVTGEVFEIPFASGTIIEEDKDYLKDRTCWVRVDKPGLVKTNVIVRLRGMEEPIL